MWSLAQSRLNKCLCPFSLWPWLVLIRTGFLGVAIVTEPVLRRASTLKSLIIILSLNLWFVSELCWHCDEGPSPCTLLSSLCCPPTLAGGGPGGPRVELSTVRSAAPANIPVSKRESAAQQIKASLCGGERACRRKDTASEPGSWCSPCAGSWAWSWLWSHGLSEVCSVGLRRGGLCVTGLPHFTS